LTREHRPSDRAEEEGIHVHAFREPSDQPTLDETYGEVVIDGVRLDSLMVRLLMAQSALPSLKDRVLPIICPVATLRTLVSANLHSRLFQATSATNARDNLRPPGDSARQLATRY
jgi:hypothetical protein